MLKSAEYKNAIVLYKAGKYEKAIAQFEKMKNFRNAADYLEKCRMGRKYMNYDYDGFSTLSDNSERNMTQEEKYEYLESCVNVLYTTWYYYDGIEEKRIIIDKFKVGGREYGLLNYYEDPTMPEFDIYYDGNKDDVHRVSVLYDNAFFDVTDDCLLTMTIDDVLYRNYDSITGEYYDHLQQEAWEAAQPAHTKEEVYAIAKQDVKNAVYGQMNIFDQVGYAVSVSWDFESLDTIQYAYNPDTNIHSLEFSVHLSEYKGLGGMITERLFMQYYEEENGSLTKTAMYRVE